MPGARSTLCLQNYKILSQHYLKVINNGRKKVNQLHSVICN